MTDWNTFDNAPAEIEPWPWRAELLGGDADGEQYELEGDPPYHIRIPTKPNKPQFVGPGDTLPDLTPKGTFEVYERWRKRADGVLVYRWIRTEHGSDAEQG